MRVYISPLLAEGVYERTQSLALTVACFSFSSYLYDVSIRPKYNVDAGVLYSSKVGRKIYTSRLYNQMIRLLKDIGAIEQVGSYRRGEHPKSYRLCAAFRDVKPMTIHAPGLQERIAKTLYENTAATSVRQWLEDIYLKRSSFASTANDVLANFTYDPDKPGQETSFRVHHDRFVSKVQIWDVAKSGRITYVPNLIPKPLRHTILIDGDPLVEVDIVCSQPRLVFTLLDPAHPEHAPFASLLDSGSLYETAASWIPNDWTPKQAKGEFFHQILYGPKHAHYQYPLWAAFESRFPHFASLIYKEKRGDKRVFPTKIQSLEAKIMIDGVVRECADRQIPLLAVHDSIAVKLKDVEAAVEMINRHWTLGTGYAPRVRVDGEFMSNATRSQEKASEN